MKQKSNWLFTGGIMAVLLTIMACSKKEAQTQKPQVQQTVLPANHADVFTGKSPLILNEYNGVSDSELLEGEGEDTYFGQVEGNGGDWIELVVTKNHFDARGFVLKWEDESESGQLVFSQDTFWADLPAGCIITITVNNKTNGGRDTDLTLNQESGDWWANICLTDETYISGDLEVTHKNWNLTILDAEGQTVFGPLGENAPGYTGSGVNSREAFKLQEDPTVSVNGESSYDDTESTTFGGPNTWAGEEMVQDFELLRTGEKTDTESSDEKPLKDGGLERSSRFFFEKLKTFDVPGLNAEIPQYCASEKLLMTTNPMWKTLDLFEVDSLLPPQIRALDFDEDEPEAQGLWTVSEPTSVAVHPNQPIAFVSVLGESITKPGRLIAFDLRKPTRGGFVLDFQVGIHPDSVAVSPDGKWAVVACEAEGHPDTVGSVWVLDIAGITAEARSYKETFKPKVYVFDNLRKVLDTPNGEIEPEYVTFDPLNRFVAVSCQENDAVVFISLNGEPKLEGQVFLPWGSEPDGISIINDVPNDEGKNGCLLAVAEEGKFDRYGNMRGQTISHIWFDPNDMTGVFQVMNRIDIRPLIDLDSLNDRRDPENIMLTRFKDRIISLTLVERGDRLIALDVTHPKKPELIGIVRAGDRPEGVTLVRTEQGLLFITGDEGDDEPYDGPGPGEITFALLSEK